MTSRLHVKDLINVGIFAAVYIIVMMAVVTALGMVPLLYAIAPVFVALICATIYMLFVMRAPKTGAVFVMSVLMAFVFMGASYYASIWVLLVGVVTEVILLNGGYQSLKRVKLSYLIYSLTTVGPYFGVVLMKDVYLAKTEAYYGAEYADALAKLLPPWVLLPLMGGTIVAAFFGALLGERILKKHFRKAGIV
ncbi:MAG: energy-coupling factor transport system substrate-specific component [Clostridiales bacterium]|jgi:energy-coupling factor transport system substrate-specific component|nr:energy-coupling factor transport system substrate-specific component [Clostridiales bacterium]